VLRHDLILNFHLISNRYIQVHLCICAVHSSARNVEEPPVFTKIALAADQVTHECVQHSHSDEDGQEESRGNSTFPCARVATNNNRVSRRGWLRPVMLTLFADRYPRNRWWQISAPYGDRPNSRGPRGDDWGRPSRRRTVRSAAPTVGHQDGRLLRCVSVSRVGAVSPTPVSPQLRIGSCCLLHAAAGMDSSELVY